MRRCRGATAVKEVGVGCRIGIGGREMGVVGVAYEERVEAACVQRGGE